jgi:hypothetical protein
MFPILVKYFVITTLSLKLIKFTLLGCISMLDKVEEYQRTAEMERLYHQWRINRKISEINEEDEDA